MTPRTCWSASGPGSGSTSSRSTSPATLSSRRPTGSRSRWSTWPAARRSSSGSSPPSCADGWLPQAAGSDGYTDRPVLQAPAPKEKPFDSDRLTVGVAARLSRYLQVLTQAKKMGRDSISSQEIGEYTNVNATQIRRDLSGFGKFGKRGVGYNIDFLVTEIRKILRTSGQHNIVLIGAGRLGSAIASSPTFADHGFNVAGVFDSDPAKVGTVVGEKPVLDVADLPAAVRDRNIIVGV